MRAYYKIENLLHLHLCGRPPARLWDRLCDRLFWRPYGRLGRRLRNRLEEVL